jgi:predicted RND superfamily exporter protein
MSEGVYGRLGGGAAVLVGASSARPRLVRALCALLTAGSAYVAATMLTVDTDSDRILSSDMPVRQTNIALAEAGALDRFSDTLITLTPLVIGTVTTAAMSVFANIIVLPLILGVGVDSGIHLVQRQRSGLRGARNLLRTSTARGVLFSALTTGASFATLALSNHLGISSLAQMLTIGVALMLAANITVLPSILTLVSGDASRGEKRSS